MKTSSFVLALLAAATSPALAAAEGGPQETNLQTVRAVAEAPAPIRGHDALKLLALETDLTARDVRLVLTTEARNARYDLRFERDMARRFAASLGPERFADLVAGLPIELHSPAVLDAASNMTASASGGWARDGRVAVVVAGP
jgi:hypothetical protein